MTVPPGAAELLLASPAGFLYKCKALSRLPSDQPLRRISSFVSGRVLVLLLPLTGAAKTGEPGDAACCVLLRSERVGM